MPTGKPARASALLVLTAVSTLAAQSRAVINLDKLSDPIALEQRLRAIGDFSGVSVSGGEVHQGNFRIAAGRQVDGNLLVVHGNAELAGKVNGNLVVLDGNLMLLPGGVVSGDALALGGAIRDQGGSIQGERRTLESPAPAPSSGSVVGTIVSRAAGLVGVLVTMGLLGFGIVLLAHPQLETISDTVTHSLGRSFLTGLLAQIVVLPTVGMLITGLVLSVVGILLVPFVLIVVPLLLIAFAVGGFLAVAHAMGELRVRRRLAGGARIGANSYRYLVSGLGGIAAVWVAWILFGWVPVAGVLIFGAAFLVTWLAATIGFGAALLSRGGVKPAFAGRYLPPEAMTDEYLWATPQFGVDAVKRPKKQ